MNNRKTPRIRFKGFTDDWEQRKLLDLIIEYKETVDSDCNLPILTSSKTEGVVLQEDHFGRVQNHDITGYNILPRNYCTYRNRSDGVDFTFNINRCCDKGIISKFYPVFYGNNSDIFFISMVLNYCDEVVHEIAYTCTGTGQKVLSFLDLQKMNIRVASYDEQKKISQYFEQLDHLITLHQRKLEKLKIVKKAMLENCFPKNGEKVPKFRFFGFTGDWEQRKFSDLVETRRGLTYKPADIREIGVRVLRSSNIDEDCFVRRSDDIFVDVNAINIDFAKENDILITAANGSSRLVGKHTILSDIPDKSTVHGGFMLLGTSEEAYFANALMSSTWYKKFIDLYVSGGNGAIGNLNKRDLDEQDIFIPTKKEQQVIGHYFASFDHLITLHQRKLEKLKIIKKSFLEKMFV